MDRVLQKLKSLKRGDGRKLSKSTSLSSSLRLSSWDFETSSDDEEWFPSSNDPVDVPTGCFPVYVGPEQRRFVLTADHLRHPWVKALLVKSAEEFGYESDRLLIPCEAVLFEHLLWLLDRSIEVEQLEIDELLEFYS